MILRRLKVKEHLTSVAESMGWDSRQPSEWKKIGMLRDLLLPFAEHIGALTLGQAMFTLVYVLEKNCSESGLYLRTTLNKQQTQQSANCVLCVVVHCC